MTNEPYFLDANIFMYAAGIDLFAKHHQNGLEARDAIHAAVMKNNGVTKLLSVDRDFDLLDFVTRVDPLTFEA